MTGGTSTLPSPSFMDPWLVSKNRLAEISDEAAADIERRATSFTRGVGRRNRRAVVNSIFANLADQVTKPSKIDHAALLAVPILRGPITRYDREEFPRRCLSDTLRALEDAGMIIRHDPIFKRLTTTIEPSHELLDVFQSEGITGADIGRYVGGEPIWLAARSDASKDKKEAMRGKPIKKVLVDYTDTEETLRLRSQMEGINAFLNGADIRFDGKVQPPVFLRRSFTLRSPHDPEAFNLSGRMFNGFWQNTRKTERHLLTIGGEPVADLDFSAMFARLAYLHQGCPLPPSVDPYLIEGLENHRTGAKMALLSLLSRAGAMKSLTPELKALLPAGWTAKRLVSAFTLHHPRIAPLFGSDVGIDLMFTESQLLVSILSTLNAGGMVALPMHDGIMVPLMAVGRAADVMTRCSAEMLGIALPITEKEIWRPS